MYNIILCRSHFVNSFVYSSCCVSCRVMSLHYRTRVRLVMIAHLLVRFVVFLKLSDCFY